VYKNEVSAAVARIKAYIARHLQDRITAADLAQIAGYSQYHMIRLFKEEVGLSPFEYLRRERLTAAAHALREGKPRVIDVALAFTFDSHEGFTRAFTKAFGISPKQYANQPPPQGWLVPRTYPTRPKKRCIPHHKPGGKYGLNRRNLHPSSGTPRA